MVIHFNELLHRFPRHLKVLPTAIVQDSTRLIILWCRLQSLKQFMSSMLSIRKFMLRLQVVNKTCYKHIALYRCQNRRNKLYKYLVSSPIIKAEGACFNSCQLSRFLPSLFPMVKASIVFSRILPYAQRDEKLKSTKMVFGKNLESCLTHTF